METSFLSESELLEAGFASLGSEVLVSRFCNIYGKENLHLGDNVRIDDFAVIYVGKESFIANYVHIAPLVVISSPLSLHIGSYTTISSRCAIYGQTDDFSGDFLTNPTVPSNLRKLVCSEIQIGEHVIIGTGSTVLPGCEIAEGTAIGAMTLVNRSTQPWSLNIGIPSRKVKDRSKKGLDKLK